MTCNPHVYIVTMERDANGNIVYRTICGRCGAPG